MGNSNPSKPSKLPKPQDCLKLDEADEIDGGCNEILHFDGAKELIDCYLTQKDVRKLCIAILGDRIKAVGLITKHCKEYPPPPNAEHESLVFGTSAIYLRHENPFLFVAMTSTAPETSHFLLKFELSPLYSLDTSQQPNPNLFEAPIKYPINASVLKIQYYDDLNLLVTHKNGCSLLEFDSAYHGYTVMKYFPYKSTAIEWCISANTVVTSADGSLIMEVSENGEKTTYTLENEDKEVCSMAVYEPLCLLFLLTNDKKAQCYYIQVWDLKLRILLIEKALIYVNNWAGLTKLVIKPCIKMTGAITIIVFSTSNLAYLFEYCPMPVFLTVVSKLKLNLRNASLATSYIPDGNCYLFLSSSLHLLPKAAFLPHKMHPFWTAPVIASYSDLGLKNQVETLRTELREPDCSMREALERMVRTVYSSAAMSHADTAISGDFASQQ